jgi:hypothetical protein
MPPPSELKTVPRQHRAILRAILKKSSSFAASKAPGDGYLIAEIRQRKIKGSGWRRSDSGSKGPTRRKTWARYSRFVTRPLPLLKGREFRRLSIRPFDALFLSRWRKIGCDTDHGLM